MTCSDIWPLSSARPFHLTPVISSIWLLWEQCLQTPLSEWFINFSLHIRISVTQQTLFSSLLPLPYLQVNNNNNFLCFPKAFYITQNAKRNLWNVAFKDINGNWYSSAGCRLAVGTQMCPFKILLFALSPSRYHYLKSLWHGPCCWHSCGLGVNAQDVPRCCQPAQQLHKNTQSGKMISQMCRDSLRNVFLTGALENVYVMGWDHNLDKSFYLICSLWIQLVNLYLAGLCFHWKNVFVFFCQVATTVACKNQKLYFPG